MTKNKPHLHFNERTGKYVECFHEDESKINSAMRQARQLLTNWQFWLGMTISFPIEHWLWTKLWPLAEISHYMGLLDH